MELATRRQGWTMVELVVVMAVASVISLGISAVFFPQVESYFYLVHNSTLQSAASRALRIIVEGNHSGRGLRFAGTSTPITAASADSVTYQYYDLNDTSNEAPHEVTISYNAVNRVITRTVDGSQLAYLPYFAAPGSGIYIDPLETDLFKYYDASGSQLADPIDPSDVYRIEVGIEAVYFGGLVQSGGAKIRMKTGVFIKRSI